MWLKHKIYERWVIKTKISSENRCRIVNKSNKFSNMWNKI